MTKTEARRWVEKIEGMKGDDEMAHSEEDDLYFHFIKYISVATEVEPQVRETAKEILKSRDIDFCRWCA